MNQVLTFCFMLITLTPVVVGAQTPVVDKEFKENTIQRLNELMIGHYVFPEVAQKTADHLQQQFKAGFFDPYEDLESFAEALTTQVQSINKDKHMRIRKERPREALENTPERMIEDQLHQVEWIRNNKAGFREVKRFDGNIGYLDLRGFAPLDDGRPVADHYMALLADSDAIIVDLRKNGGGSPAMVQYLCSYFFDQKVHLNSLYWREGNRTDEFWTLEKVNGKKMPDVPLYVLTSSYTFSGAEEFSYNMQTQKRATLVGETTGGGANPGGGFPLGGQLSVFIPTGKAINPITGTNWEGVGVVPEVKTSADEALDKALELANTAAEDFRQKQRETYHALLLEVQKSLDQLAASSNQQAVLDNLKKCHQAGLLGEGDINMYGYQELQKEEGGMKAEAIFWSNTQLFPQSANVYDSYGEALAMNGKLKESLKSYEKAVALAEKNQDNNLDLFKENLEKVKAKLKAKP